jgi:hypothetical protein
MVCLRTQKGYKLSIASSLSHRYYNDESFPSILGDYSVKKPRGALVEEADNILIR